MKSSRVLFHHVFCRVILRCVSRELGFSHVWGWEYWVDEVPSSPELVWVEFIFLPIVKQNLYHHQAFHGYCHICCNTCLSDRCHLPWIDNRIIRVSISSNKSIIIFNYMLINNRKPIFITDTISIGESEYFSYWESNSSIARNTDSSILLIVIENIHESSFLKILHNLTCTRSLWSVINNNYLIEVFIDILILEGFECIANGSFRVICRYNHWYNIFRFESSILHSFFELSK